MAKTYDSVWQKISRALKEKGIDLDSDCCGGKVDQAKVVCIAPDLSETLTEMRGERRDQVVMVRLDKETTKTLDRWVEAGAVKSRSEAATLFIREGLKVRSNELNQLKDAIQTVESAREHLREQARNVLGSVD